MEDNNINQENIDQNPTQNSEKLQEISEIYNNPKSQQGANTTGLEIQKSPIDYYILAFQKYAQFSGRATRNEYWWFYLVTFAVSVLAVILDTLLSIPFLSIYTIYLLVSFIPGLAVLVRRLHDTGKSGWLLLILFIPFLGVLLLLIFMFTDSNPGDNKYGPNPKGVEA